MNISKFLEIEKKYKLYDANVYGAYFWMYRRFNLWNYDICRKYLEMSVPHPKKNQSIKDYIVIILKCIKRTISHPIHKYTNKDILIVSHPRRAKNGDKYECLYTDRISLHYGESTVTVENPFEMDHMEPALTNNIIYLDYIKILVGIKVRLYKAFLNKKYKAIEMQIKHLIKDALVEIGEFYDWEPEIDEIVRKDAHLVLEHLFSDKMYRKLLNKINPKLMIVVVSYDYLNMHLIEIAKEYGIKTIELQHGTLYPGHAAYNFADNCSVKQFPDYVFLFSDFWRSCVNLPINANKIIATGYPQFEEKLKLYNGEIANRIGNKILFISQGTIGIYLSKLAIELSAILGKDYKIVYKLHPSEYSTWKDTYSDLENSDIEVIDNSSCSIYKYFAESDIQIGSYSTALYEGLGFGLKTYIYKVGHYDNMQNVIDMGYAEYVDSAEELATKIRMNVKTDIDNFSFWKSNSFENIIKAIDRINGDNSN